MPPNNDNNDNEPPLYDHLPRDIDLQRGLSTAQVQSLHNQWGSNTIPTPTVPLYIIWVRQFTGFLPLLIAMAALVSLLVEGKGRKKQREKQTDRDWYFVCCFACRHAKRILIRACMRWNQVDMMNVSPALLNLGFAFFLPCCLLTCMDLPFSLFFVCLSFTLTSPTCSLALPLRLE